MALPQVIPNSARLSLYYALGTELGVNTFGCTIVGSVTFGQALADALGTSIKNSFAATWGPHCPATVSLARVGIRDLRTAHQPEYRDAGAPVAGTAIGDPLPYQNALCITLRTAQAGRSFRGRVYLPGASEAANDATGRADAAVAADGVSFVQLVASALTSNGLAGAILSMPKERTQTVKTTFHNDGTTSVETISQTNASVGFGTPITSVASRTPEWESQRRRINRRSVAPVLAGLVASAEILPA